MDRFHRRPAPQKVFKILHFLYVWTQESIRILVYGIENGLKELQTDDYILGFLFRTKKVHGISIKG